MEPVKHVLVTRASFDNDMVFEKYFPLIRDVYIPSIGSQTCKTFDVCMIMNIKHKSILLEEFKKYNVNIIPIIGRFGGGSYPEWAINNKYQIQTRHDCDDWMAPTYIQRIQEEYFKHKDVYDDFLIQAIPTKVDYSTKKERVMKCYSKTFTSMFLSLCQKEPKISVFKEFHTTFPKLIPNVIELENGLVKWIIHGNNISLRPIQPKK